MSREHSNIAAQLLSISAAPALLYRGETITHEGLHRQVCSLAAALVAGGAARGERVGLWCDNAPAFVVAYLGTIWAGLTSVPLHPSTDEATFAQIARSTGMQRLLVQSKHAATARAWVANQGLAVEVLAERSAGAACEIAFGDSVAVAAGALPEAAVVDPARDLAAIIFTSGSTGAPKGVMITHRNIAVNTHDIIDYLRLTADDRVLAVLPLSYCYGASLLHTHLAVGGSVVLVPSFRIPEQVLDELTASACTGLAGVPSTYQILLRKTTFPARRFPALRWLQQAGGKLPDPFIRELREAHPDVRLYIMYGQTEATARLSYLPPEQLDRRLGSIGRGLRSTRLEVIAEDGSPVVPGSGTIGEIVASGENLALGYWNDPAETEKFFVADKLRTGDLARVDEEGYIYIVDRARDFIKSMGNRVSAKEIEGVIAEHPGVVEVAVVGAPDEVWGEVIWAFVVPREPDALSAAEIKAHCNAQLPNFKVPQCVSLVRDLPRNSAGKILKPALRARAVERQIHES